MWEKIKTWITLSVLFVGLGAISYIGVEKYISTQTNTVVVPVIISSDAEIVIDGPTVLKVGQLARLNVEKSSGKVFKWQVLPETDNFQVYDNGTRAVFSSPIAGDYVFIVAGGKDNTVDVKTHTIKVVSDSPVSPVNPPVNPPVQTLSNKVVEWVVLVQSASKKQEAIKLADSFNNIAQQIQGGQLTTVEQITEATKLGNRVALGQSVQSWVPFLEKLQKEMQTQAEVGALVTLEQHTVMWRQIAEGLKLAGK